MNIAEIRAKFPMYKDLSDRELVKGLHKAHYSDMDYPSFLKKIDFSERVNPTEGMSTFDKAAAGAGKAVSDLGLGIRQITGFAPQSEVDEVKERDKALMDTGAGIAGNVAGNVAMSLIPGLGAAGVGKAAGMQALQAGGKALLAAPATLGGVVTQGGMGALQAGLQPVASGESRAGNAALGFAGGAVVPAAGMALKGGKAAVEPLYEGGRQQILARALRSAAGQNTDDVVSKLGQARELVTGSMPTAGEVAESGGIAAMQRAAAAVDPESYATRAMQQNEARVAALREMAGEGGRRSAITAIRDEGADEMYKAARAKGIDPELMTRGRKGEVTKLMNTPAISQASEQAKVLARNEMKNVADPAGSVLGLDYTKQALDDMIEKAVGRGQNNEARVLGGLKDRLLTTIDTLSPTYAQARESFGEMSRIPNQMSVADDIAKRSINPLTGQMQPQVFAKALSDDTAARATGFSGATLANTMEPQQLSTLNAIKDDLARSVQARDLGRGPGSDTVQKLAMTNLMEQSGIPVGVLNAPGIGRLGNFAYSVADDKMKDTLAKALLNPKKTASIMQAGAPNPNTEMLAKILRSGLTPVGVGGAPALLDAR